MLLTCGGMLFAADGDDADKTTDFLWRILPLGTLPRLEELSEHFRNGLVFNQKRVLLPIYDRDYHLLTAVDAEWANWIEPVSRTGAYDLALHVVMAVQHVLHGAHHAEEPSSKLEVPCAWRRSRRACGCVFRIRYLIL